ncbi:MAG: tetratricopeptide repeat protein [Candidatus Aminicenantes bacterium]|nr:tetratricopeptide repeat protein [Candidatus Aminicenantes bacterium]
MRHFVRAILVLLVFFSCLWAQEHKGQGRLIGYVFDEQGHPLEGVKVKLFSLKTQTGFEIATDKNGRWVAAWIRGGGWNIDFEKFGYIPRKISVEVQEFGRNPEIKINLKKAEGLIITDDLKMLLQKGNDLFEQKKYEEAIIVYNEVLQKYPDAYIIYKNIGNCYFNLEKYEEAEAAYQKILDKDPQNVDAIILIGNTYANRGLNDKAMEWYRKINFEKIEDPIVLYNLGTNYYNNSKFEEALKFYLRAVELQKDFLDAIYQLGLTYLTLNKTAEAIQTFENYLKIDADSERAQQVKGFLEYLRKK